MNHVGDNSSYVSLPTLRSLTNEDSITRSFEQEKLTREVLINEKKIGGGTKKSSLENVFAGPS